MNASRSRILNNLWDIQNQHRYLPQPALKQLASELGISLVEVEGVASFYHFFHFQPAGKFTIYLNNSIISEFHGFKAVKEAFEKETGATFGGTDPSGTFGLFETPCIGLSDQEPAALINFQAFTHLTPVKVKTIIYQIKSGRSLESIRNFPEDNIRYIPDSDKALIFRDYAIAGALKNLQNLCPDEVIELVKQSKLSGYGGAFYPTGLKWESCKNNAAPQKYIVCNADEGEPGTFKDRVIMNRVPGLMLEGMIMAGYATGATEGIIYLRAEYRYLLEKLENTIAEFKAKGWLGNDIPAKNNFAFDIRIVLGAGAYVCGEETAMLESIEGKRGEPRTRKYYPTEKGLFGFPTVVNNVETLAAAARILELGLDKVLSIGTKKSPGTKLLSVSGDVKYPGVYEIEWGMGVRELLDRCGAENPYYVQMSGPSGQGISVEEFDRKICKEEVPWGGSVMVFNKDRDLLQILANFSDFFKHESCGLCTPCRAGNFILGRHLEKIINGLADQTDIDNMIKWSKIIKLSSRCGLGQTSPNSFISVLEKFPDYFQERLLTEEKTPLNKGFDLEKATRNYDTLIEQLQNNE